MFDVVLVGADDSPTARRAVEAACEICAMSNGTLHILTAFEQLSTVGGTNAHEFKDVISEDDGRALLQTLSFIAKKHGVEPVVARGQGRPRAHAHRQGRRSRRRPDRGREPWHEGRASGPRQRAQLGRPRSSLFGTHRRHDGVRRDTTRERAVGWDYGERRITKSRRVDDAMVGSCGAVESRPRGGRISWSPATPRRTVRTDARPGKRQGGRSFPC